MARQTVLFPSESPEIYGWRKPVAQKVGATGGGFVITPSVLTQDVSAGITGAASTGQTVKGNVVRRADSNAVGFLRKYLTLEEIEGEDFGEVGANARQNVYTRLTNKYPTAQPTNITGVTIGYVDGEMADATLTFTAVGTLLKFATGADVNVGTNGVYILDNGSGAKMVVKIVAASLPVGDQTDAIAFSTGYRAAFFLRNAADGLEKALEAPAALANVIISYNKVFGIDDLPWDCFAGVGETETATGTATVTFNHVTDRAALTYDLTIMGDVVAPRTLTFGQADVTNGDVLNLNPKTLQYKGQAFIPATYQTKNQLGTGAAGEGGDYVTLSHKLLGGVTNDNAIISIHSGGVPMVEGAGNQYVLSDSGGDTRITFQGFQLALNEVFQCKYVTDPSDS